MTKESIELLAPGDHFYAIYNENIFYGSAHFDAAFSSLKEIVCCFNHRESFNSRSLIFIPKPFGNPCALSYPRWLDGTFPRQWNHIWISDEQLNRVFLRKTNT